MKRIVVSGAVANKPRNGGNAWAVMSWVSGLRELGWEVYFLEQLDEAACRDSDGRTAAPATSLNAAYFDAVVRRFGLEGCAALLLAAGGAVLRGPSLAELREISRSAALLVNISGHLEEPSLLQRFRRRAYVDFDPGYTQVWQASGIAGARLEGHDCFFTLAENLGSADCCIPDAGLRWQSVRQPVVLSDWPFRPRPPGARYTTVASWRGAYGPLEHGGRTYGPKAHELRRLAELPARHPDLQFEIALDIHAADEADRQRLSHGGWRIACPADVAATPGAFRAYVQASAAEVSAAQPVYVYTNSGWFSDRTVRYLASGRPAIVQDAGFSRYLPAGRGLLPYRDVAEVDGLIDSLEADYEGHSRAARAIAEQYFDSRLVLGRFLEEAGV